jgi:glucose/arabinose dehydrogenase
MSRFVRLLLVLGATGAVLASRPGHGAATAASSARKDAAAAPTVLLQPVADGLPDITSITHAGDGRLFVTLQRGQVVIWDGSQVLPTPFLDLSSLVICCGEQGLLSIAFHPNYAVNGFFFVDYTDLTGRTIVARYRISDFDANQADAFSGVTLLTIDQPYANHNGGQLQFGPDGLLYIGMGDGGSGNDPQCHAQSSDSLLGKMLRIDVNQSVDRAPYYGIPAENPYVSTTGPAEAWAFGLRNPWRFSFDRLTGDLFIGDVGQDAREEIDYQPLTSRGGQNYGWKVMEGTLCGAGGTSGCTVQPPPCGDPLYTLPILEYSHDGGNCAVTGGYMYRGRAIPDLQGSYVYGDYCSGRIWAASLQAGTWSPALLPISASSLTTFGEDVTGELYVGASGTLYEIVPPAALPPTIATIAPASGSTRGGERVRITGTNFTSRTGVAFGASAAAVTVQSSTVLVAVAPPHPPGLVDVAVANPGVTPAVRTGGFGYVAIPVEPPRAFTPRVVVRP